MNLTKITKFQRDTLASLKALDYDAFARQDGTVEVSVVVDAPRGGICTVSETIVSPADLTKFLARFNPTIIATI